MDGGKEMVGCKGIRECLNKIGQDLFLLIVIKEENNGKKEVIEGATTEDKRCAQYKGVQELLPLPSLSLPSPPLPSLSLPSPSPPPLPSFLPLPLLPDNRYCRPQGLDCSTLYTLWLPAGSARQCQSVPACGGGSLNDRNNSL